MLGQTKFFKELTWSKQKEINSESPASWILKALSWFCDIQGRNYKKHKELRKLPQRLYHYRRRQPPKCSIRGIMHNFKVQDYKKRQACLYKIQEFQGVVICYNYYMLREIKCYLALCKKWGYSFSSSCFFHC